MATRAGFSFKLTDEETIVLLKMKRLDPNFSVDTITELDVYSYEPWELPRLSVTQSEKEVWYFFCQPHYKYAKSKRTNRKTKTGFWKLTGKACQMKAKKSREAIGIKKILSFRSSKNPNAEWVMHEIAVEDDPLYLDDFVICRIERKRNTKHGMSTIDDHQSSSDLMNSEFYNERIDDLINSTGALLNESSHEEPGQTVTADLSHQSLMDSLVKQLDKPFRLT